LYPIGTLYPSQNGGPSNTVYWMAKGLVSKGIEVTCISTSLGIDEKNIKLDEWFNTDYGRVMYTKDKIHSFPIKWMYHSFKEIKRHDIIHLNSLFYFPSIILSMICVLLNKKLVWSVRGTLEDSALKISPIKKKLALFLVNQMKHKIIFHSTSSQESASVKTNLGNNNTTIEIPNFIEIPLLIERELSEKKELLYLGRLHPIKAIDQLILALAQSEIFNKDSNSYLNIAGVGTIEYTDYLKSLVCKNKLENKVSFLGQIEGLEKQRVIANSYFCILPSYSENFGNVVLEALAQSTPVIASKGCPWKILEEENAGFWIENDVLSLKNQIEFILNLNQNSYLEFRKKAYLLASKYDIKHNNEKWTEIYSQF
jgi:glycosyltransferase involved in cell wall biosynthesis